MKRIIAPRRGKKRNERTGSAGESDDGGSWRNALRKALIAVGLFGLVYVVSRRAGNGGPEYSTRRQSPEAGPGDVRPSEGRRTYSTAGSERASAGGGESVTPDQGRDRGEGSEDETSRPDDEELPGRDRTPGEIEERAVDDAEEEPAEPGEMTVDEEVVDDIVDEEDDSDEAT